MLEDEYKGELSKIRDLLRECNEDIGKPEVANIIYSRAIRDAEPSQWPDITNFVLLTLNELRMPRYVKPNRLSNMGDMPACLMELYGSRALTEVRDVTPEHAPIEDIDLIACAVPEVGRWWYIPDSDTKLSEYCVMDRRCPYPPTETQCVLKSIGARPASPKEVGDILEAKCREAYNIEEEKYSSLNDLINKAVPYIETQIEKSQKTRESKKIQGPFTV